MDIVTYITAIEYHILQVLYDGLDTGKGWSTVHLQLTEMLSLSGQPANVRIEVIPDPAGTIMIAGLDSLTISNGVCRHMGKWCIKCHDVSPQIMKIIKVVNCVL